MNGKDKILLHALLHYITPNNQTFSKAPFSQRQHAYTSNISYWYNYLSGVFIVVLGFPFFTLQINYILYMHAYCAGLGMTSFLVFNYNVIGKHHAEIILIITNQSIIFMFVLIARLKLHSRVTASIN